MLLRFSISNFLSFFEKVVFDMFPNQNRVRFPEHIYQHEIPLLKESAIYGSNGSGKSNFIKAAGFFQHFLTEKDYLKRVDVSRIKYRLVPQNNKPVVMEMEFTVKGKYYLYIIRVGESVSEEFYESGIGKKNDVLEGSGDGSLIRFYFRSKMRWMTPYGTPVSLESWRKPAPCSRQASTIFRRSSLSKA